MSVSLEEALKQVHLEIGKTYTCEVNGKIVEMRVREAPPLPEADIMLDAWVELPEPGPGVVGYSQLGEPDWPDVPEIPTDEETP